MKKTKQSQDDVVPTVSVVMHAAQRNALVCLLQSVCLGEGTAFLSSDEWARINAVKVVLVSARVEQYREEKVELTYKTGDVVALRSGGPKMTISEPSTEEEDGTVVVNWFRDGEVVSEYFHQDQLERALKETP